MMSNVFEIKTFDGESICFEYNNIIICNNNIKEALMNNKVEIDVEKPYIVITNNNLSDDQIDILENASIADCFEYIKAKPAFGGIIV